MMMAASVSCCKPTPIYSPAKDVATPAEQVNLKSLQWSIENWSYECRREVHIGNVEIGIL